MPLRSGFNAPQSEVQAIIDDYRSQDISDEKLEARLSQEFSEDLWKPILHPEGEPEDDILGGLTEKIGPRPEEPNFPSEIYQEYKHDFTHPLVKPIIPKGPAGYQYEQLADQYNNSLKERNNRSKKQSAVFGLYNDQVEEFNYNSQAWNDAANDIIEDENRELYESSIKIDKAASPILELPERANPYTWTSALGEERSMGKFSALDFGIHIFAKKTQDEIHAEMLEDQGYVSAMAMPMKTGLGQNESFNFGSDTFPRMVGGSPQEVMDQVKMIYEEKEDPSGYLNDDVFKQALKEKVERQEAYGQSYMKEWFTKYAQENVFNTGQMSAEDMAQAEADIFEDTGLYINLDGNNVIGEKKAVDFWNSVDAGWMKTMSMGNGVMFQANAMMKAFDYMINGENKDYDSYDTRMDEIRSRRKELDFAAQDIRDGMTRYYMTRTEALLAGDDVSIDVDEIQNQSLMTVLKGLAGFDDSFSKMERMETLESAPTSVSGQAIGTAFALATRGKGAKAQKGVSSLFNFLGKSSIGASMPMGMMVGGDKFAEIYDDPFFSTFTDSDGNEVSSADASLQLTQAQMFGESTATYESIGLTRDRNDAAILGYTAWEGGGEVVGEVAGGFLFKGIGKYVKGNPLSSSLKTRMKQYLGGLLAAAGVSVPEEYSEELLTEALQYGAEMYYEEGEFNNKDFVDRVHKAGLSGATLGPLLGSVTGVAGVAKQEYQVQQMTPEELNLYQLRFAYNGVYDRMDKTAKKIAGLEVVKRSSGDEAFTQELDNEIAVLRKQLNKNNRQRVDKAQALIEQDADLARRLMTSTNNISRLESMIRQSDNEDQTKILEGMMEEAVQERQKLNDETAKALTEQKKIVVKNRDGVDEQTDFTEAPMTEEEKQDAEGLASRRPTQEDGLAQDELDDELDLEYDSRLVSDQIVMIAGEMGVTFEQGEIDEKKMQEGVMSFLRSVAPDIADKNVTIITYGSAESYESDPAIVKYMGVHGESPAAYADVDPETGKITRILVDPRSTVGDAQHEVGHVVLRSVYDNPTQRMELVERILELSNRKGNEVFRAWVNSTITVEGSSREALGVNERAQEELLQNFFQGYVSGEWKVFNDKNKQIEVNRSVIDRVSEGVWDFLAVQSPSVRSLNIKDTDGLVAVSKKFQRFVANQPNFVPKTEKVVSPLDQDRTTRPEAPREKLDPASLFKENPQPTEDQKDTVEKIVSTSSKAPVATQESVPVSEPKQETESSQDYQDRLSREADELLKGVEGLETPESDALSQDTEGLASQRRSNDFVAGKKIYGYYNQGWDGKVMTFTAKDYAHYRNWVAKITGNGSRPFDFIKYEKEDGSFGVLRAPKPIYNKDGTKRVMKNQDVRPFKVRYQESRNAIVQSGADYRVSKQMRYNKLTDFAKKNGFDLTEYIDFNYGDFTLADIEQAEVQMLARASEEPGATYNIGVIDPGRTERSGRVSSRDVLPSDQSTYERGRNFGYTSKRRTVDGVGKFSPAFNMQKAIDEGVLSSVKNIGELRELLGDESVFAMVAKYAPTSSGTATFEMPGGNVRVAIKSGIYTPVTDYFEFMKKNGRAPSPSEINAISNTNPGKQSEIFDNIKYRSMGFAENSATTVVYIKNLGSENPAGDPGIFEAGFKVIDKAIEGSSDPQKALGVVVEAINQIMAKTYNAKITIGKDQKIGVAKENGRSLFQKLSDKEMKGSGLISENNSLRIDPDNMELGYKNFKKFFVVKESNKIGFEIRKPLLLKLLNNNYLGSKKNSSLLGLPSKKQFLDLVSSEEHSGTDSASGDIVGAILIDNASSSMLTEDASTGKPYLYGVTGFKKLVMFDEFATEAEVESMMLKRNPEMKTGGIGAQASGLAGLTSKRRAGRIYYHGAGQWEKSDSNMFGSALSSIALKLQDKYFDVIMLQDDIENYKGQRVKAGQDFDMALDLMYGKTRDSLERLEESLDMIKGLMEASEITSDQLSDFLYAKHVKERNDYVSSKNANNPAGSGKANAWASQTLKDLESPEMNKVASLVYSIIENTRKTMVKYGLETQETIDAWTDLFEFYVPLAGLATDEMDENNIAYPTGGAGMGVYGTTQKKIKGRKSEVRANIVAQVVMQNAMVTQTARKNEAMMHLYRLIKNNPNSNVWGINTSTFPLTRLNEQGEQEGMTVAEMKMNPHTVPIRVDGKTEFLFFKNKSYANTLNGMTVEKASIFTRSMNSLTGFMRNMLTVYDPNFMISNYARDIQAAAYNAMAEAEMEGGYIQGVNHKKFAKDLMSNMYLATGQLFKNAAFGVEMSPELESYMAEWSADGGKTGWGYTKSLSDITAELEVASNSGKDSASREFNVIMGSPKRFANYIEGINEAFEASTRLASYIAARQNGVSREKAAQLSKNITVNFNRGGEWQFLNSVYLFFNAAMQGNARFLRSMYGLKEVRKDNGELESWTKRVKTPQKIAFAMASFSGLIATMNLAMSGSDPDDGELWYNKIPDYHKERNLIFMHRDGKNYSMIPLPYGYNIFNNLGTVLAETSTGNRDGMDGAMFLGLSAFSAFSPIGFGQSKNLGTYATKAVAPTVFKPIVEIAANETYFGSQVYRDRLPFTTTPYSQLSFQAPEDIQEFFQWMNEASGGSKYRSGTYDYNPDQLWYMYEYYIGSAGRFVGNTGELATNMYEMGKNSYRLAAEKGLNYEGFKKLTSGFQDKNKIQMRPSQIPLIRKIYGEPSRYFDSDLYKENTFEVQQLSKELKEEPILEPGRYRGVQELNQLFKETNKALQFIRAQRRGAKEIEDRTKRINLLYDLDERQRRLMTMYNKRHEELRQKN